MRYLLESGIYSEKPWFKKIARLITMGTPHFGAPKVLHVLGGKVRYGVFSGPDIQQLANDPRYPSAYELVPPLNSALTTNRGVSGNLPSLKDPFDDDIETQLKLNADNIKKAQKFWNGLNLGEKPQHVKYFFVVGSALKTTIRNEWIAKGNDPFPVVKKASGDGTVPIASALAIGVPHIFSQKKHATIFADREVRKYLYRILDAPDKAVPQSADGKVAVGDVDAYGISMDQEVYDPGEEIEVAISFNQDITKLDEDLKLIALTADTGAELPDKVPLKIKVSLQGVSLREFTFSISENLEPGLYELRIVGREPDDPGAARFYVQGTANDD